VSTAIETSFVRESARGETEFAACPRCGSADGGIVVEGKDYLCGIDGRFFGWQCAECGLQYQNPRPTADRLAQLYPSDYGPHVGPSAPDGTTLQTLRWRDREIRNSFLNKVRLWLNFGIAKLLSLHHRTGIGFFRPTQAEMQEFLRQQMGYTHLNSQKSSPAFKLSQGIIRECRRVTGIDLVPHYVADGRLLEIGCATGGRLQSYRDQGWMHLEGIELTEQAATQARQRGFPVICEQVETALDRSPDQSFDVIVSSMVLEHLYDPFGVVRTIARKLRPGGQFLFSTITRDALDARLFGKYWSGYDFPRHMVYLRTGDIQEMVSRDFDQVEYFHQNAPIDFLRPATWRRPEKKLSDRLIARLAKAQVAPLIGEVLARMGQTCRVSFRCRRK
jgi:2-polyprenyl-3-methyl-5-hydroxy-6-metoxy-1,4-benzoquinol methylase